VSQHIILKPAQFLLFPSERKERQRKREREKTVSQPIPSEAYIESCEVSAIFAVPLNVFGLKIHKQEWLGVFAAL
jgi:hypothetical protein